MIKKYPTYKPTSIPWLPELPEHWDSIKAKYLFTERSEKGHENEPLLAATQTQGVVPKDHYENRTVTAQKDFHLLKLVREGDFVISLRSFQGGIEYAYYQGIISPAYTVLFPHGPNEVNRQYFKHLFKSHPFINSLTLFVTGIREGQNIDYTEFKDSLLPFPPPEEQTAIANYLDHKCKLIDDFIAKKQRMIELLKEKKIAIIDKAVTKGIIENVELRPSGIDWLGDIPEHWELRRLGVLGRFSKGGNISRAELINSTDGVPAILYGDIYTKYNFEVKSVINHISEVTADNSVAIYNGDLLFTGSGETQEDIGKCVLFNGKGITYAGGDVIIFKQKRMNSFFICYSQNSSASKYQKAIFSKGEIIVHIYGSKLKDLIMPYPPSIEEQQKITNYIKTEISKIEIISDRILNEIEHMKEYKQSLMEEVVTGKIDVRNNDIKHMVLNANEE